MLLPSRPRDFLLLSLPFVIGASFMTVAVVRFADSAGHEQRSPGA